jgi:protein gp37
MSDLFNEKVSNGFIVDVFNVMNACPQHQFMILTKRSKRMREWYRWVSTPFIGSPNQGCLPAMCDRWEWPLPNVWIGVSVEDQPTADERISDLQATPAARRFVSLEPCLAPVIFKDEWLMSCHDCGNEGSIAYDSKPGTIAGRLCLDACEKRGNPASISLVIMGCESGPHARPMELDWARQVRDACVAAKVPYFLKQANIGGKLVKMPELDGKAWDQLPEVKHG